MNEFEINVRIGRLRAESKMSKQDIEVLLVLRRESFEDLARRAQCSRENLSRLLNGRAVFPGLRIKLAAAIEEMLDEMPRSVARRFFSAAA